MMLSDFVRRAQLTPEGDHLIADLQHVRAFVFGESYLISMKNGKSYDVRDLEVILSVIHDEFELWREQWVPSMEFVNWGKPTINGNTRVMQVTAVQPSTFLPALPTKAKVDAIRHAVTVFNIAGGSWDQFERGNL